jgi:biopolymer transport protein ExbD
MAEQITTSEKQACRNRKRMNKKSTRVDLTPMVDLGFLLITFFVFTTAMSTARAMGMVTPNDKTGPNDPVCESCVITVVPAGDNKVYYYEGAEKDALYRETNYSATGLRKLLADKKSSTAANHKDAILIIKPGETSSFKNLVDIIDESTICMYKRYYLDKLNDNEAKHIQ